MVLGPCICDCSSSSRNSVQIDVLSVHGVAWQSKNFIFRPSNCVMPFPHRKTIRWYTSNLKTEIWAQHVWVEVSRFITIKGKCLLPLVWWSYKIWGEYSVLIILKIVFEIAKKKKCIFIYSSPTSPLFLYLDFLLKDVVFFFLNKNQYIKHWIILIKSTSIRTYILAYARQYVIIQELSIIYNFLKICNLIPNLQTVRNNYKVYIHIWVT